MLQTTDNGRQRWMEHCEMYEDWAVKLLDEVPADQATLAAKILTVVSLVQGRTQSVIVPNPNAPGVQMNRWSRWRKSLRIPHALSGPKHPLLARSAARRRAAIGVIGACEGRGASVATPAYYQSPHRNLRGW